LLEADTYKSCSTADGKKKKKLRRERASTYMALEAGG
jgi:hypothetical protein